MRPLDLLLLFLILALPLVILHDLQQTVSNRSERMQQRYSDAFQAAVDDTAFYLTSFEAQQKKQSIQYNEAKQLEIDEETLEVFKRNLALKFGIDNNKVELNNLMLHIPAMVFLRYDGYVIITLEDTADGDLEPAIWPVRPYTYMLPNGNVMYFTLEDELRMYVTPYYQNVTGSPFAWVQGTYEELKIYMGTAVPNKAVFEELRRQTIASHIETDLGGAINRHLELVKRMGLSLQFSLPRGLADAPLQHVGLMAILQGYPLPGGERLDAFSLGGGSIVRRKELVGTVGSNGLPEAVPRACLPSSAATTNEVFFDPVEAARKGYFIRACDN
ncbi:hypothetical protein [Paenibacillus puerhi]|uniref:hypothetical protein n=1 Tax=Paenibacillus puerhi TaxID=2692622 RepID=UPI00135713C1|nr:hypothetical protein [Paenibacillus puerhi]